MVIDVVLVAFIALFAAFGSKRGLFKSLAGVLSFAISVILVYAFSKEIFAFLRETPVYGAVYDFVLKRIAEKSGAPLLFSGSMGKGIAESFTDLLLKILLVVIIFAVVKLVIRLIDKVFHLPVLKSFNRLGGLVFGLVQGFLAVYIILAIWGGTTLFVLPKALETTALAKSMFENNLLMIMFK